MDVAGMEHPTTSSPLVNPIMIMVCYIAMAREMKQTFKGLLHVLSEDIFGPMRLEPGVFPLPSVFPL